ncbi:MAG TPA: sarcosine oxidase subunit gamma family protein [Steroidobacter sp.]|uniref:sarcosine oxidase subunit gamma n=1 Tax=Steroidobacter sp. TaxID=1978227 RepID=UPI002EDB4369
MLETYQPRAVLEIHSWLPELKSGQRRLSMDGRELPSEAGATRLDSLHVLCVAPGRWTVVSDVQLATSVIESFAAEIAAQGAVLIDVTDGIGVLNVSGPLARDVLSKGCGLDLHPSAFPAGRCARTRFAQLAVLIEHIDDAPSFRLYFARSYQRFLIDWIEDAAVEFQSASQ